MQKSTAAATPLQNETPAMKQAGPKGKTIAIAKPKRKATAKAPAKSGTPYPQVSNAAFAEAYKADKKVQEAGPWVHKSLANDLRRKAAQAHKEIGGLVDEFLFEDYISNYISTLQNQLHDLAVAESTIGDAWCQPTPNGISDRMGAIHRTIIFWTKVEELNNYSKLCLSKAQNEEMKFMLAEQKAVAKAARTRTV